MKRKTLADFQATFSSKDWPRVLSLTLEEDSCSLVLSIDDDIRWFEGHFPGQPVLAGVVQTHWAGEFARWFFSIDASFVGMDNLKFQTPILPGKEVALRLSYNRLKHSLAFKYFDDESSYSEGRLAFAKE